VIPKINAYGEIELTGTASSPSGRRSVKLRGTVSTVTKDGYSKVWPDDGQEQVETRDGGKIWFMLEKIESVTIISSDT